LLVAIGFPPFSASFHYSWLKIASLKTGSYGNCPSMILQGFRWWMLPTTTTYWCY